MDMEQQFSAVQKLFDSLIEYCVTYGFSVLGAIIVLIIGAWVANQVSKLVHAMLDKKKVDITLTKFTAGFVKVVILSFAVLIALSKFGITIAPFIAAIGAMAFGASFAFQGPLANYGAGLSLILSRPFSVGDTLTVQGYSGIVQDVKLAMTIMVTGDGEKITIPNKHLVGEILVNSKEYRIVDAGVGVSYSDDMDKAINVIADALKQFSEISQSPAPQIGIQSFGDSSVNISFRYWVPTKQYYQTLHAVNLAVFKAIKEAGLNIPFPQRDLHIISQPNGATATKQEIIK